MARLILHIGTHKTATTSIQRFFKQNQTALAERGVFYPDYSLIGKTPHYAQLGMVNALSGRHKNYNPAQAERFFRKVVERVPDYDTTIISAEPFYRHVLNDPHDDPVYAPEDYWPLRHAYIARIRDLLGEAEVVVVFRRQADYAQSLYQEHVKVTRYKGKFRKFLEEFWFHFAFNAQAEAWDAAFPGLRAMSFDRLMQTGDVVSAFCHALDLPVDGLTQGQIYNQGLPVDLVVLKRILHRTSASKEQVLAQMEQLAKVLPEDTLREITPRSFFQSAAAQLEFQHEFDAENEALRRFMVHDIAPDVPMYDHVFKPVRAFGDQVHPTVLSALVGMALQP